MRTLQTFGISLALMLTAGGTMLAQTGQNPAPANVPTKIGFIYFQMVLEGTDEAQQEIGKVRTWIEEKQRDLEAQQAELQKLKDQFAAQQRTLNPETRAEMQRSIEEKEVRLKRTSEDLQLEINRKREELFGRFSEKVQKILTEYAQQNQYGAILFLDQLQAFVNPALDLTDEIIAIYNQRHPVASASAAQGSTPPPQN